MSDRSYAQIRWHKDRFGLMLVNAERDRFFLYADKLRDLYDHQKKYRVVKLRDRKPSRAVGYYPGQVVGALDLDEETVAFYLYISEPYRDVQFKIEGDDATPEEYHVEQVYSLPREEFLCLKAALDLMDEQERGFTEHFIAAEMTPLIPIRRNS